MNALQKRLTHIIKTKINSELCTQYSDTNKLRISGSIGAIDQSKGWVRIRLAIYSIKFEFSGDNVKFDHSVNSLEIVDGEQIGILQIKIQEETGHVKFDSFDSNTLNDTYEAKVKNICEGVICLQNGR